MGRAADPGAEQTAYGTGQFGRQSHTVGPSRTPEPGRQVHGQVGAVGGPDVLDGHVQPLAV
ncbi:hypothetical protein, partial [Streptomyces sp. NPDC005907]|uniref:hypothetical protein n=1 Tax=Streptomyces sp. NPDC005907 TaxID=3154571 RepID=UPI00340F254F